MMMNVNEANVHGVESKNDNESNEHDLKYSRISSKRVNSHGVHK